MHTQQSRFYCSPSPLSPPRPPPAGKESTIQVGGAMANYTNPLGRVSLAHRPGPDMLARASVISVSGRTAVPLP